MHYTGAVSCPRRLAAARGKGGGPFALSGALGAAGAAAPVLQSLVLIVAVAVVILARGAAARGWLR